MSRLILLVVTVTTLAAAAAGAGTTPGAQILSARLDGGDVRPLTTAERSAIAVAAARDGRIVFVSRGTGGRPAYWVMNGDGGEPRELAPAQDEWYFGPAAWSPNGRAVALARWDYSACFPDSRNCARSELAVVDPATAAVLGVVRSRDRGAGDFSWSPDGSRLALAGSVDFDLNARTVETVRRDGTGRRVLVRSSRQPISQVAWSPRGDRIAYVRGGWIWLVGPNGGATTRVVSGSTPVWSPTGARLMFLAERGVKIMDLATGRTRALAGAQAALTVWSPDGRRVAFRTRSAVWVLRAADGRRLFAPSLGDVTSLSFSPDGSRLVYTRRP